MLKTAGFLAPAVPSAYMPEPRLSKLAILRSTLHPNNRWQLLLCRQARWEKKIDFHLLDNTKIVLCCLWNSMLCLLVHSAFRIFFCFCILQKVGTSLLLFLHQQLFDFLRDIYAHPTTNNVQITDAIQRQLQLKNVKGNFAFFFFFLKVLFAILLHYYVQFMAQELKVRFCKSFRSVLCIFTRVLVNFVNSV